MKSDLLKAFAWMAVGTVMACIGIGGLLRTAYIQGQMSCPVPEPRSVIKVMT